MSQGTEPRTPPFRGEPGSEPRLWPCVAHGGSALVCRCGALLLAGSAPTSGGRPTWRLLDPAHRPFGGRGGGTPWPAWCSGRGPAGSAAAPAGCLPCGPSRAAAGVVAVLGGSRGGCGG